MAPATVKGTRSALSSTGAEPSTRVATSPEQPRLLLIEDDPQLGPLIAQVLSEGYAVSLELDGNSGMTAGLSGDFDVMVIDRRLPSLDGLTVIEALRGKRVTTPILVLTALGTVADRVRGLDAGATTTWSNPSNSTSSWPACAHSRVSSPVRVP